MTPQLEEALRLLRLARRDQEVFLIVAAAGGNTHAAAGFHAQQAVEKTLKALLCASDLDYPRTHDLESLACRLDGSPFALPFAPARLRPLTPYAVDLRYDDEVVSLMSETEMRTIVADLLDYASEKLNAP
jgi:HEPN domain-containing protein